MQNKPSVNDLMIKLRALNIGQPLTTKEVTTVETSLNVKLPKDFLEINYVCSYEFICFLDTFNFGLSNKESVIDQTLYHRNHNGLLQNYLVLFGDDVSFVLLKIVSPDASQVIWCLIHNFLLYFR